MKPAPVKIREVSDDRYLSDDGHVMQREYGKTPGGNPLNGRWVLRAPDGAWIDFDIYGSDLTERNGLSIEYDLDAIPNKESPAHAASDRPA